MNEGIEPTIGRIILTPFLRAARALDLSVPDPEGERVTGDEFVALLTRLAGARGLPSFVALSPLFFPQTDPNLRLLCHAQGSAKAVFDVLSAHRSLLGSGFEFRLEFVGPRAVLHLRQAGAPHPELAEFFLHAALLLLELLHASPLEHRCIVGDTTSDRASAHPHGGSFLEVPVSAVTHPYACSLEKVANIAKRALAPRVRASEARLPIPLSSRIEALLREEPKPLKLSSEVVAGRLGLSTRTLQRRLAHEELSYEELRAQVLLGLALESLPSESVEAIATRLGYSDERSLRRALIAWTGKSTGELREHLAKVHADSW